MNFFQKTSLWAHCVLCKDVMQLLVYITIAVCMLILLFFLSLKLYNQQLILPIYDIRKYMPTNKLV